MGWIIGFLTGRTKRAASCLTGPLFAALTIGGFFAPQAANGQTPYEAPLYSFSNTGGDGQLPGRGGLVVDSQNNLYGTTSQGGANGEGAVYELVYNSVAYSEQILYSFSPTMGSNGLLVGDGGLPEGSLLMDSRGDLYGTTAFGGANGDGTVFELVNNSGTWTEQILYSFSGPDGSEPEAGLIMDSQGNLYGTTSSTVFELVNNSGTWSEQTLHSFSGGDGSRSLASLIMDSQGNLYGTTSLGGAGGSNCTLGRLTIACGTVFELMNNSGTWTEQILYSFSGSDGSEPEGGLVFDSQGNLWGTTSSGGSSGGGTVFELTNLGANPSFATVYNFGTTSFGGSHPLAGLIMDGQGNLYGTTSAGGGALNAVGSIFELVESSGYSFQLLHDFIPGGTDGTTPIAPLVQNASGVMFGTTQLGGTNNVGTVYQLAIAPIGTVPTNTSLTYAPNPPAPGATVVFTAVVTAPSLHGLVVDEGNLSFYSGSTLLGTSGVLNGVAALSVDAETQESIGDGTVTAQYAPPRLGGKANFSISIFAASSGQTSATLAEPGVATTNGSNTFNGNQTVNGTVNATGFTGNGSGLTGVSAASLNCTGCVGNSQLGVDYAGSASQGGPANSALSASIALNAMSLGGDPLADFPTLASANTFTAAQSMPGLNVTGAAGLAVTGPAQAASVTTGSITIGGGTKVTEVVSATFPITLPAINPTQCTTLTTGAVTGFTPGTSDTIALGLPSSVLSVGSGVFLMYEAWETNTGPSPTITIQVCNPSGSRYKGGNSGTIRVDIIKH